MEIHLIVSWTWRSAFQHKRKFALAPIKITPSLEQLQTGIKFEPIIIFSGNGRFGFIGMRGADTLIFGEGRKIKYLDLKNDNSTDLIEVGAGITDYISYKRLGVIFASHKPTILFKNKKLTTIPFRIIHSISDPYLIDENMYFKTRDNDLVQCDMKMMLKQADKGLKRFNDCCKIVSANIICFAYSPLLRDIIIYDGKKILRLKKANLEVAIENEYVFKMICSRFLLLVASRKTQEVRTTIYRFLSQSSFKDILEPIITGVPSYDKISSITSFDRKYGSFILTLSDRGRASLIIVNKQRREFVFNCEIIKNRTFCMTHCLHKNHIDIFIGMEDNILRLRLEI
jgi:hypothetical protein